VPQPNEATHPEHRLIANLGEQLPLTVVGAKAWHLSRLHGLGLPTPRGFVLTIPFCHRLQDAGASDATLAWDAVKLAVERLQDRLGRRLEDPHRPLLLAIRQSAATTSASTLETVLNLGVSERTIIALGRRLRDSRAAWDAYRRFVFDWARTVGHLDPDTLDSMMWQARAEHGVTDDAQLGPSALQEIVTRAIALLKAYPDSAIPESPWAQLRTLVHHLLSSPPFEHLPRALIIQEAILGNLSVHSGCGLAFTRHPTSGVTGLVGEFVERAQGASGSAGLIAPATLAILKQQQPKVYRKLALAARRMEQATRDAVEMDFMVECGRLYFLNYRIAKRSFTAAVQMAVSLVREGLIDTGSALMRIDSRQVRQLLFEHVDAADAAAPIAHGIGTSPGAVNGVVAFDIATAKRFHKKRLQPILVCQAINCDAIANLSCLNGILTARGGMSSHAAVVARNVGIPCVSGCRELQGDPNHENTSLGATRLRTGDRIAIDGHSGQVYLGHQPILPCEMAPWLSPMLAWADDVRRLSIYANVDTITELQHALAWGAAGVGLCRSERFFMRPEVLPQFRDLLNQPDTLENECNLEWLLPLMRSEFDTMFRLLDGRMMTLRLMDCGIENFLDPHGVTEVIPNEHTTIERWHETNPVLGLRGCRIGIRYPALYRVQVRAFFESIQHCLAKGVPVQPALLIPMVSTEQELLTIKHLIEQVADTLQDATGDRPPYELGIMIETPRAALAFPAWRPHLQFAAFGTNDLTQLTFGFSRDDAENVFLPAYLKQGILSTNPFVTMDQPGVGALIRLALRDDHQQNGQPIRYTLCGEHASDPDAIRFVHALGIDAISCSPSNLPGARVAAAQAALILS